MLLNMLCDIMLQNENSVNENINNRRKNLCCVARDISDKYDFALFKYPIKFVKIAYFQKRFLN